MPTGKLKIKATNETKLKSCFGISGAIDFYRLAYFIEKALNQTLEHGLIKDTEDQGDVSFYKASDTNRDIYFIKNQLDVGLFFNKAKQADYLVIIVGKKPELIIKDLKFQLLSVGAIQSIFAIEDKFSSKTKLKYFD